MTRQRSEQRVYKSRQWRAVRAQVLERDGNRCQISGDKCTQLATEVDHIVPMSRGGAAFDPANLRAACKACNSGRASQADDGWRVAQTQIILVMGPPCSGKTTFVAEHSESGDMRIDYDEIAAALGVDRLTDGLHDSVSAARNAVLRRVRQGRTGARRVWLISANPNADKMFPHHEVVVCDPGVETCLMRCDELRRPVVMRDRVREWYRVRAGRVVDVRGLSRDW